MPSRCFWVRALAGFLTLVPAQAAFGSPKREIRGTVAGRLNEPGLQNTWEASWTRPLYRRTAEARAGAGVSLTLSPSYARWGPWIELSPLPILDFKAGWEPLYYFGAFGSLLGFQKREDDFGRQVRDDRDSEARSAWGRRLYAAPAFKARVGSVAAHAGATFEWWKAHAPAPYFYEPFRDTLLKSSGDRLVATRAALLYEHGLGTGEKMSVGPLHQITRVRRAPANRVERLGALVLWEPGPDWGKFQRPLIVLEISRYLEDPFKEGEWTATAALRFFLGKQKG
jgi:hypothetical protein